MMKKTFYMLSVSAALFAAGCSKSEQPAAPQEPQTPAEESGIVLYAQDINSIGSPAVKTVTAEDENGKFTVNWAKGDQIAVYTVPAGTDPTTLTLDDWQKSQPVRFITDEAAEQEGLRKFTLNGTDSDAGKLTAFKERYAAGNLDWYAVYPGLMETPSHAGKGMISFGKDVIQNGNSNMGHLAQKDVLFGKVKDSKEPVIEMQHLGTLMEFTVSNGTAEPFTVQSITVSTSVMIAGEFRLNLTKEQPLDKTDGFNQSGVCTLKVNDAEAIGTGEAAKFYQVLAPFELGKGKTIAITVDTDKGGWSKTMTVGEDGLVFEAGKKYTAKLSIKGIKEVNGVNLGIANNPKPASGVNGGYLNLETGTKFWQPTEADYPKIDLIAVYVKTSGPKLVAPGDAWTFQNVSGMEGILNWSVRNSTLLKETSLTEADYNAVKNVFDLKKIYEESTGTASTGLGSLTKDKAKGKVYAALTASGKYALIHYADLVGWSNEMNDYITLNLKIEE